MLFLGMTLSGESARDPRRVGSGSRCTGDDGGFGDDNGAPDRRGLRFRGCYHRRCRGFLHKVRHNRDSTPGPGARLPVFMLGGEVIVIASSMPALLPCCCTTFTQVCLCRRGKWNSSAAWRSKKGRFGFSSMRDDVSIRGFLPRVVALVPSDRSHAGRLAADVVARLMVGLQAKFDELEPAVATAAASRARKRG